MELEKILNKYAHLVLKVGLALKKGDNIVIKGDPVHWDFALRVQRLAYEMGANLIEFEMDDPRALKNRIEAQDKEYLKSTAGYRTEKNKCYTDEKWKFLRLDGLSDPDVLAGLSQERFGSLMRVENKLMQGLSDARMSGRCLWTIAGLPTEGWAAKVFNEKPSSELVERFWKLLIPILRLDSEDPVEAWESHNKSLKARCKWLNDAKLDYLHFKAEGTDLKVYRAPKAFWLGGGMHSPEDGSFIPNMPTEEVFTVPDYLKTEGCAKITRPVMVLGTQVEGAWFEFKDGKVVNFGADKGEENLGQFLKMDEGSSYLGEMALVDSNSPIFKSEKVYHSILFDENAACHIALGRGIPIVVEGFQDMDQEKLKKSGCNSSIVHVDFMIGSSTMDIDGYLQDGEKIEIMRNGKFVK